MNQFYFWKDWSVQERLSISSLLVLFVLSITVGLGIVFGEFSNVYNWNIKVSLDQLSQTICSVHSSVIESQIYSAIPVVVQKATGKVMVESHLMTYTLAVAMYVFLAFVIAVCSSLSRFWFVVSMGFLILLLSLSGFGEIALLGLGREMSIGVIASVILFVAYFFHGFRSHSSLFLRFVALLGLFVIIGTGVYFLSENPRPLQVLAYRSYWLLLIFSVIFILMVGHEIVYSILVVTTKNQGASADNNNAIHFIVFSIIYLLNVALIYMHNARYITWDIYYVNPVLLLSVSAVLGLWGLKARAFIYENTVSFRSIGVYVYLAFGTMSFLTISFLYLSSNDAAIEVIEDAIVFGHLAFGGMFFIYILVNFVNLLLKGLPIYRIAFKEDNFPYATSRLAGVIVVAAFFFASNYASLNQAVSGFFNQLGDMALIDHRYDVAKENYRRGAIYGNFLGMSNGSQRSNFMYASLEADNLKRLDWLKNTIKRNQTEQSYVTLGVAYEENNQFFDAIFTYQDGLEKFPDSWALQNNLGLLYQRISALDSADYYLSMENNANEWQKAVFSTNAMSLATRRGLAQENESTDRLDVQANTLANLLLTGEGNDYSDEIREINNTLNPVSYAYLKNFGLWCAQSGTPAFLGQIDAFLVNPNNDDYAFDLSVVKALNLYKIGRIKDAFELLNEIYERTSEPQTYVKLLLGKWAMELGAPRLAADYFEVARENGYPVATADLVQAYVQNGEESLAQYLLSKEIAEAEENLASRLSSLSESITKGEETWIGNAYSYQREEDALKDILSSESADTTAYLALGQKNPFYERGVLEALGYFKTQGDNDQAYGILLDAITINQYSEVLIKAYINQCLEMGLISYAESTVIRLIDVMTEEEFKSYEVAFEQQKDAAEAALNSW